MYGLKHCLAAAIAHIAVVAARVPSSALSNAGLQLLELTVGVRLLTLLLARYAADALQTHPSW